MKDKTLYDYIIIGSGFGGSVSAMRLSEKGYKVLVIEKGKHYKSEDFPKTNWDFRKFFWAPVFRWFGIQKLTFFKQVFILSGVGVGGGSLVYANTHMVPPDEFFNNPKWSKLNDWKNVLMPFFKEAKFMLGTVKNPCRGEEDQLLQEVAKDMGKSDSFGDVNVGVFFGDKEKPCDPYFKGHGPQRTGCTECAGCMVGCRHNAKNTLDKNYLYFAQKFGAVIKAETQADLIQYENGIYSVQTRSSTGFLDKKKKTFRSSGLVISGGVLGTLDLLLKQKIRYKTLDNLSNSLGENLRTNSECLCGITAKNQKLNNGIAITSVFNPDNDTHIEIVKYPDGSDAMKLFATLATNQSNPLLRPILLLWNLVKQPKYIWMKYFKGKWSVNTIIFLVMQSRDNAMRMVYKRSPFSGLSIKNDGAKKVPAFIGVGQDVMHRYAKKVNGIPQNAVTEVLFNMSSTAHILGGCPMSEDAEKGVVNSKFQVHNYPNMYILDGSIIPCNLGVNPSLTITALSEYAMSMVPDKEKTKEVKLNELLEREFGS